MIKFDPSTIFIIGGIQDRSVSNKTWIVNPMDDFKMRPGHVASHFEFLKKTPKLLLNMLKQNGHPPQMI